MTIYIKDIINSEIATSPDDAEKLYNELYKQLKGRQTIQVSFKGVDDFISSFLNASVGRLYDGKLDEHFVDTHITVIDIDNDDLEIYNNVIRRAKEYYKNPEHFDFPELKDED